MLGASSDEVQLFLAESYQPDRLSANATTVFGTFQVAPSISSSINVWYARTYNFVTDATTFVLTPPILQNNRIVACKTHPPPSTHSSLLRWVDPFSNVCHVNSTNDS
jgi:hypothetical protein